MNDQSPQSPLPPPLVMMQLLFGKQLTYSLVRRGAPRRRRPHDRQAAAGRGDCRQSGSARALALPRDADARGLRRLQGGAAAPLCADAGRRLAQDRRAGFAQIHGDDVRRGILDPRLRAYRRMSAQRRRRRDRGLRQADLGGAGRAPGAMRDLSAGDDQLHLGRGGRDRRGLRLFRHRAPRRCRRRSRPAARRDPARQRPTCRACYSIVPRWWSMCRSSSSPAAKDA